MHKAPFDLLKLTVPAGLGDGEHMRARFPSAKGDGTSAGALFRRVSLAFVVSRLADLLPIRAIANHNVIDAHCSTWWVNEVTLWVCWRLTGT